MLFINGRFLAQKVTGVQRVGIELLKALDKMIPPGKIEVLTPPQVINHVELKNIKITVVGKKSNHFWVQWVLPRYVKKKGGKLLTISGLCPFLMPDYYMAHDVAFKRYPDAFDIKFRLIYDFVYKIALKRCIRIFTVSEFSKSEICEMYHVNPDKVLVVYNSSHQLKEEHHESIDVEKWGLTKNQYYLSVSSRNEYKNQNYIIECAKKYPDETFVIVGGSAFNAFKGIELDVLHNVVLTGYVNADELYSVYKSAKGFIFPSKYEGFGIPPLEAITLGVKHIAVSDIPVFREVYSRGVYYFNPEDCGSFDLKKMTEITVSDDDREFYWDKYSWDKGAGYILKVISDTCSKN